MKGDVLAAAFTALFTTSTYAHPRGSEPFQFKVSIDVAEVTADPTYAVLFFEGSELCTLGDHYTVKAKVDCKKFPIFEPAIEVQSVTLHGFANCTLFTDSSPPNEYDLVSYGISPTEKIDPPAVFVGGVCCYPEEEDVDAKHNH